MRYYILEQESVVRGPFSAPQLMEMPSGHWHDFRNR